MESPDLSAEDLLSFGKAVSAIPGRERVSLGTLHRWRLKGVRGVRLETVLIGGQRFTSRQAIERFLGWLNHAEVSTQGAPHHVSEIGRQRVAQAAQAALQAKLGVVR
jgi:hypothetical protein